MNEARTGKCTNCIAHEWDCVFGGPGEYSGYIEALELKVNNLESLIKRLLPEQDFTQEIGYKLTRENWMMPGVCGMPTTGNSIAYTSSSDETSIMHAPAAATFGVLGPAPLTPPPEDGHSSDEEQDIYSMKLQNLPVITFAKPRDWISYMGKSSAAGLLNTAITLCSRIAPHVDALGTIQRARKQPDWIDDLGKESARVHYHFPEPDLLDELVRLYFIHVHTFAPILHRPTFETDRKSGLHLWDHTFGSVVLMVCALAARFSHDPRAHVDGDDGWKWFIQVRLYDAARIMKTTSHLHGLQTICLGVMYSSSTLPVYAWVHAGIGIRLALDIGAHKRRAYGTTPTIDDELYKRTFWMLLYLDRTLSGILGRPCSMQEEDFDLEPPLCCDDEYLLLGDPPQLAKQPENKASHASYFVWMLKLSQIHGLALRTLYASTKARAHYNFPGEDWITRTIAHLDSLLNNWVNSVPDHLRWDPKRVNDLFFCQSAHLYMQYHELRITIHRQFIATPQPTPTPAPALTICVNAARSLVHLTSALLARSPERRGLIRWDAGYAGLMLLVGLGVARLHGFAFDRKQAMADVDIVISILRLHEASSRCAGRYSDAVEVLKAIGAVNNPEPAKQGKRRHDDEDSPHTQSMFFDPSLPSLNTHDTSLRAGLDAPSIFTSGPAKENDLQNAPAPQSIGSVLGNIDFGALFGFGNASVENPQTHYPAGLPSGDMDMFPSNPGSEDWMGTMPFDLGMDDWGWLEPGPARHGG